MAKEKTKAEQIIEHFKVDRTNKNVNKYPDNTSDKKSAAGWFSANNLSSAMIDIDNYYNHLNVNSPYIDVQFLHYKNVDANGKRSEKEWISLKKYIGSSQISYGDKDNRNIVNYGSNDTNNNFIVSCSIVDNGAKTLTLVLYDRSYYKIQELLFEAVQAGNGNGALINPENPFETINLKGANGEQLNDPALKFFYQDDLINNNIRVNYGWNVDPEAKFTNPIGNQEGGLGYATSNLNIYNRWSSITNSLQNPKNIKGYASTDSGNQESNISHSHILSEGNGMQTYVLNGYEEFFITNVESELTETGMKYTITATGTENYKLNSYKMLQRYSVIKSKPTEIMATLMNSFNASDKIKLVWNDDKLMNDGSMIKFDVENGVYKIIEGDEVFNFKQDVISGYNGLLLHKEIFQDLLSLFEKNSSNKISSKLNNIDVKYDDALKEDLYSVINIDGPFGGETDISKILLVADGILENKNGTYKKFGNAAKYIYDLSRYSMQNVNKSKGKFQGKKIFQTYIGMIGLKTFKYEKKQAFQGGDDFKELSKMQKFDASMIVVEKLNSLLNKTIQKLQKITSDSEVISTLPHNEPLIYARLNSLYEPFNYIYKASNDFNGRKWMYNKIYFLDNEKFLTYEDKNKYLVYKPSFAQEMSDSDLVESESKDDIRMVKMISKSDSTFYKKVYTDQELKKSNITFGKKNMENFDEDLAALSEFSFIKQFQDIYSELKGLKRKNFFTLKWPENYEYNYSGGVGDEIAKYNISKSLEDLSDAFKDWQKSGFLVEKNVKGFNYLSNYKSIYISNFTTAYSDFQEIVRRLRNKFQAQEKDISVSFFKDEIFVRGKNTDFESDQDFKKFYDNLRNYMDSSFYGGEFRVTDEKIQDFINNYKTPTFKLATGVIVIKDSDGPVTTETINDIVNKKIQKKFENLKKNFDQELKNAQNEYRKIYEEYYLNVNVNADPENIPSDIKVEFVEVADRDKGSKDWEYFQKMAGGFTSNGTDLEYKYDSKTRKLCEGTAKNVNYLDKCFLFFDSLKSEGERNELISDIRQEITALDQDIQAITKKINELNSVKIGEPISLYLGGEESKNTSKNYYKSLSSLLTDFCSKCPPYQDLDKLLAQLNDGISESSTEYNDANGNKVRVNIESNAPKFALGWDILEVDGNGTVWIGFSYKKPTKFRQIREYKWGSGNPDNHCVVGVNIKTNSEYAMLATSSHFIKTDTAPMLGRDTLQGNFKAFTPQPDSAPMFFRSVLNKRDQETLQKNMSTIVNQGTITILGDPSLRFGGAVQPYCLPIYLNISFAKERTWSSDGPDKGTERNIKSYLSGFYTISKITHQITQSGYLTTLDVSRFPDNKDYIL